MLHSVSIKTVISLWLHHPLYALHEKLIIHLECSYCAELFAIASDYKKVRKFKKSEH